MKNNDAGVRLATRKPLHLEATVRVLQRRPSNLVDVWERDRYVRLFSIADERILVEVENCGSLDAPDVRCHIRSGDSSPGVARQHEQCVRRILGLDVDPASLQQLAEVDPALRATVAALRGMRPPRFADLFEAFASVIPFQQLSLDAGVAIIGRLVARFGLSLDLGDRRYHAFPAAKTIARASLEEVRACGLSTKKAETLQMLARAIDSGDLSEQALSECDVNHAMQMLIKLPGVGPWTAGLVLLRGLGRLDVFPSGDVGAARAVGALLGLPPKSPIDDVVRRFGDCRGYLYFCGLGSSLLAKGLIQAAPPPKQVR